MGRPVTLTAVNDIALSSSVENILSDIPGSTLADDSLVLIALNAEDVDVRAQVSIGGAQILPQSPVTLQATVGVLPIIPDDQMVVSFGRAGEEITIRGTNLDGAAARELRAVVNTIPTSDLALIKQALERNGIPI